MPSKRFIKTPLDSSKPALPAWYSNLKNFQLEIQSGIVAEATLPCIATIQAF
jgi:hypothetical protein